MLKFNPPAIAISIFVILGLLSSYESINFYMFGKTTEAVVISSNKIIRKNDSFKDTYNTYAFIKIEGVEYKRNYTTPSKLKPGDKLIVHYLPKDPSTSTYYKSESEIVKRPLFLCFAIIATVIYLAVGKKISDR